MRFSLLFFSAFLLHCILFFLINVMNVERVWKASIFKSVVAPFKNFPPVLLTHFSIPIFVCVPSSFYSLIPTKSYECEKGVKRFLKSLFCCSVQKKVPSCACDAYVDQGASSLLSIAFPFIIHSLSCSLMLFFCFLISAETKWPGCYGVPRPVWGWDPKQLKATDIHEPPSCLSV